MIRPFAFMTTCVLWSLISLSAFAQGFDKIYIVGPGNVGVATAAILKQSYPDTPVQFLSRSGNPPWIEVQGENGFRAPNAVMELMPAVGENALVVVATDGNESTLNGVIEKIRDRVSERTNVVWGQNGFVWSAIEQGMGQKGINTRLLYNFGMSLAGESGTYRVSLSADPTFLLAGDERGAERVRSYVGAERVTALSTPLQAEYRKAVVNLVANGPNAIFGGDLNGLMENPGRRFVINAVLNEVVEVARALNIDIGENPSEKILGAIRANGTHRASMAQQVSQGRFGALEVGPLYENFLRLAEQAGVEAPMTTRITRAMAQVKSLGAMPADCDWLSVLQAQVP